MKKIFLLYPILISHLIFAQCDGRYQDEIFSNISKTTVEYTDVYDWSSFDSGLDMDIYQAEGDIVTNRAAKAFAAYHGRSEVTVEDIENVITLCLRHRLRKDPLESIDSGDKVSSVFEEVFK